MDFDDNDRARFNVALQMERLLMSAARIGAVCGIKFDQGKEAPWMVCVKNSCIDRAEMFHEHFWGIDPSEAVDLAMTALVSVKCGRYAMTHTCDIAIGVFEADHQAGGKLRVSRLVDEEDIIPPEMLKVMYHSLHQN